VSIHPISHLDEHERKPIGALSIRERGGRFSENELTIVKVCRIWPSPLVLSNRGVDPCQIIGLNPEKTS